MAFDVSFDDIHKGVLVRVVQCSSQHGNLMVVVDDEEGRINICVPIGKADCEKVAQALMQLAEKIDG